MLGFHPTAPLIESIAKKFLEQVTPEVFGLVIGHLPQPHGHIDPQFIERNL